MGLLIKFYHQVNGLTTWQEIRSLDEATNKRNKRANRNGGEGDSTDPDILRLMVNCSHMSDASRVSWGPTKLSNCSQKSRVNSAEAKSRDQRIEKNMNNKRDLSIQVWKRLKYSLMGGWLGVHLPLIIKQAAALMAWKWQSCKLMQNESHTV